MDGEGACADCPEEAIDALGGVWLCATHLTIRRRLQDDGPYCIPEAHASPYAALYGDPALALPDLYVGGNGTQIKGQPLDLHGARCFTAAHGPRGGAGSLLDRGRWDAQHLRVLLDSGAFSEAPAQRLTLAGALERQLDWERAAAYKWGRPRWRVSALVAYDVLIDEKWDGGVRAKARWAPEDARWAIRETIRAAEYLSLQRGRLRANGRPRTLVLPVQGVTAEQYAECAAHVLAVSDPSDWLGLGGWCIVGKYSRQWLPVLHQAAALVIPMAAQAGIRHAHIFGVLYPPALAPLLWLCDRHGLTLSTDSARPIMDATRPPRADRDRNGGEDWPAQVDHWRRIVMGLRRSPLYGPVVDTSIVARYG